MLAVLRRRDFALLWTGGLVSTAGDWVLLIALPYYVYARTGSTVATAAMIVAELAPNVLLGSIAGVFVDRWDRKRVLVVTNLLQALTVGLLVLVPLGWLWVVFAVAAIQSTLAVFSGPAEGALLPELVDERDLVAANALNALNNRLGRLIGAPVGGALLAFVGLEAVVVLDALSFAAAALLIAAIRIPARAAPAAQETDEATAPRSAIGRFWAEWLDGLALVRQPTIAVLFLVFGLGTFGGTMLDPLTVAWVRDVLKEGPEIFSLLTVFHASAGLIGTLLVGRFGSGLAPRTLIGWPSLVAAVLIAIRYNVPAVPLALALSAAGGVTSVISSIGVETLAQRSVRPEFRGRVFGSLNATLGLLSLAGAMTAGALAEVVGTVTMLNVSAALIGLSGAVALRAIGSEDA